MEAKARRLYEGATLPAIVAQRGPLPGNCLTACAPRLAAVQLEEFCSHLSSRDTAQEICFSRYIQGGIEFDKRSLMNLREISAAVEKELISLFEELRSGMAAREDSRAFGAMIERRILDNWDALCER